MTLNETVAAIADAIREKTGKSELIAPVNFAEEIKGITAGGESGGGTMEYLDISGNENKLQVVLLSTLIKLEGLILPAAALVEVALDGIDAFSSMINSINQIAVDGTLEFNDGNGDETIGSAIDGYDSIPRITKEQFYDLNA
jgi:hypothetical protein